MGKELSKEIRQQLDIIDACTGSQSTPEQLEFAADFTKPLVSFSNPGTGKSHSIIKGLIMAQTYHRIPGRKINAMSFTQEATAELKARYDKSCKACDIAPTVTFNTFHRICNAVLREKYPTMKIKKGYIWEKDLAILADYMKQYGVDSSDMFYVKKVLINIDKLNHSLIYDDRNVELSYDFRELEMPLEPFQKLRRDLFVYGIITKCIPQGDIPLYALYVLANNPDIQKKYKEMYKIMVVDEFQDMTKLYLVILSMISSNLVVIGDMKQQIYGFNGACAEIVEEYMKIYPHANRVDLTKSFRCRDEIADYATNVYMPNDRLVKSFDGVGDGGVIEILHSKKLNIKDIVSQIKVEQGKEVAGIAKDTMFLFRNNYSVTPIAEELYKQGVLFRVKKFKTVMDLPIFRELCMMALIAEEPSNMTYLKKIPSIFPEFKRYNELNCPLLIALAKSNTSLFDINYKFRESSSVDIIMAMKKAAGYMKEGRTAGQVFNALIGVYSKYIIEEKWWTLDNEKTFYIDLVTPIVEHKTFPQMIAEEYDKARKIEECVNVSMGVKCYTMHSAKGLEANYVYIIDADEGVFPSSRNMKKYVTMGCEYEAAKTLREERNLLYVGITRAKDKVIITHNTDEVTQLISSPKQNAFSYLDEIYAATYRDFDDVGAFVKMLNLGIHSEAATSRNDAEAYALADI